MMPPITVALVGNPNSGKTTIFNALTGQRQRVTNYPGVTVEHVLGTFAHQGRGVTVVDLPGSYSLDAISPDERVARDFIVLQRPDVVVQVADATQLTRHLYLTSQLVELGANIVLVLNMMDRAQAAGLHIDARLIAERLGCQVIEAVGSREQGIAGLRDAIVAAAGRPAVALEPDYGDELRAAVDEVERAIAAQGPGCIAPYPRRWFAVKLLERDGFARGIVTAHPEAPCASIISLSEAVAARIEGHHGDALAVLIAERRQGFAAGLCREAVVQGPADRPRRSDRVDDLVTHRWLGIPIFLLIMYLIFYLTFSVGAVPMGWIGHALSAIVGAVNAAWPGGGALKSLLLDGVIGGVGNVLAFVPNIAILFLCISLIEDTGYMARAAFITDRFMHRIGLHGKSIIPLLIGFGCTVPAVMATRTLENRRDRLATMLVLPLMSCGAKLTIYLMLIPAFFPLPWRAPVLWGIYVFGILLAVVVVRMLRWTVLAGESVPFVMELPPYRRPVLKGIAMHVWLRTWMYLKKAGTVILAVSALMWFLTSYPKPPPQAPVAGGPAVAASHELTHSFAGIIGRAIEPATAPLGFDWRVNTALLGALAAKEVFIAQMGILASLEGAEREGELLTGWLKREYPPAAGLSIILFMLIAAPCSATVAVLARESGRWRTALAQYAGLTALAYAVSLIAYQAGRVLGL